MKKICIFIFAVSILFTACDEAGDTSGTTEGEQTSIHQSIEETLSLTENSTSSDQQTSVSTVQDTEQQVNNKSLEFREGVALYMSYEDVINAESKNGLTFTQDYQRSKVTEEHIVKLIKSDQTVKYMDMDATLTYNFIDDKLYYCSYNIQCSYPFSEIFDSPTLSKYNELVFEYTDKNGKPTETEVDISKEYSESYLSKWITEDSIYSIYCIQDTNFSSVRSEMTINDFILISFGATK